MTLRFAASAGHVFFEVRNPGYMEEVVQQQVFRPYFSTKGTDRCFSTWNMKLLAEDYLGGSVGFHSGIEGGTTFTLRTPLNPPASTKPSS